MEERLAISQYELRLAQEDMLRLKAELQKRVECPPEESSGRYLPFCYYQKSHTNMYLIFSFIQTYEIISYSYETLSCYTW